MGVGSVDMLFDSEGTSSFWKGIPLYALKKAIFKKNNIAYTIKKMILNSVTYDFDKTAQGGVVIVPPEFTIIEFISPDGRIDYANLLNGNFGEALTATISILETKPISAWDNFVGWFAGKNIFSEMTDSIAKVELMSLDDVAYEEISMPDFSNISNMADMLRATKLAAENAFDRPMTSFQLDSAAFGWIIRVTSVEDENGDTANLDIGFLFRE